MAQTIEGAGKQLFQNESLVSIGAKLSDDYQYCHPDFRAFFEQDDEELPTGEWKARLNKWAENNSVEVSSGLLEQFVTDEELELTNEDPRNIGYTNLALFIEEWCIAAIYQTEDGFYVVFVRQQLAA